MVAFVNWRQVVDRVGLAVLSGDNQFKDGKGFLYSISGLALYVLRLRVLEQNTYEEILKAGLIATALS